MSAIVPNDYPGAAICRVVPRSIQAIMFTGGMKNKPSLAKTSLSRSDLRVVTERTRRQSCHRLVIRLQPVVGDETGKWREEKREGKGDRERGREVGEKKGVLGM